jgi:hypothetical protein
MTKQERAKLQKMAKALASEFIGVRCCNGLCCKAKRECVAAEIVKLIEEKGRAS